MFFVAAMVAIGPFAIDTYLPAMPSMAIALGTDIVAINATLSAYLLGFALGQLIGGPVSDQIGRRPVGTLGLVVFCITSFAISLVTTVEWVTALRVIQALGGGFATVICMAMVRDAYQPAEAAKKFPVVMLVMLSAPLLAPAIGSLVLGSDWIMIFLFLGAYSLVILLLFFRIPETATSASGKLEPKKILPQYWAVLSRRVDGRLIPLRYILSQGLLFSGTFVFITNSSFIFLQYFEVGERAFPLYFGINIAMMMVFTSITTRLILRISPHKLFALGRAIQFAALTGLAALVAFGEPTLYWFSGLLALVIGPSGMINPSVSGLYLGYFDKLSGSAVSLLNVTVFLLGSILGIVSGWFFDGTLKPILFTMLAGVIFANLIAITIPAPRPAAA